MRLFTKLSKAIGYNVNFTKIFTFFFFIGMFFSKSLLAQSPGMIVEPATGASALLLDPNNDGYVSTSSARQVSSELHCTYP